MTIIRASFRTLPFTIRQSVCHQCRQLHGRIIHTPPQPTAFVPDTETFLTLIGRGLSKHANKIPSWTALFSLSGQQLREAGLEPPRARRYLLWWRERYRTGTYGVGGDLQNVTNGVAQLRVGRLQLPDSPDNYKPVIINPPLSEEEAQRLQTPPSDAVEETPEPSTQNQEELVVTSVQKESFSGLRIAGEGANMHVSGPGIVRLRNGITMLRVREGLWEQKQGQKKDGGERRRAEVRAKRYAAKRKNSR